MKVVTCSRCGREVPKWAAVNRGWEEPRDEESKYCPYCGAALPRRTWPYVLLVIGAFAAAAAARRLVGPLIRWELLAVLVVAVLAHHLWWIIRRARRRRNESAPTETHNRL